MICFAGGDILECQKKRMIWFFPFLPIHLFVFDLLFFLFLDVCSLFLIVFGVVP